jgi:hypothetical protein
MWNGKADYAFGNPPPVADFKCIALMPHVLTAVLPPSLASAGAELQLALMAEADPELQGLLPQRADRPFHLLRDLGDRRSRLRMLFQQLDISRSVWLAGWNLLFGFGHFVLLDVGALIAAQALASKQHPSLIHRQSPDNRCPAGSRSG